ncbi:hypothetical protein ACOSQ2_025700 [Xanthoceras sorbifolium]
MIAGERAQTLTKSCPHTIRSLNWPRKSVLVSGSPRKQSTLSLSLWFCALSSSGFSPIMLIKGLKINIGIDAARSWNRLLTNLKVVGFHSCQTVNIIYGETFFMLITCIIKLNLM